MTNENTSSWATAESRPKARPGWSPTERTQATSQLSMHQSSRYTGQPGSATSFQANASTFQTNSDTSTIWSQPPPRWNTTETGHSLRRAGTSPVPSRINSIHGTADLSANFSNGNQFNFDLGQQDVPFLGGRSRNSLTSLGQTPAFRTEARGNGISDEALLRHYSALSLSQEPGSFGETSSGGASRAGSVASAGVPSGSAGLPNATAASPSSRRLSYATTAAPFPGHSQRAHLQSATAFSSPGAGTSAVPYHHPNSLTDNSTPSSTAASLQGPGGFLEGGLYSYGLPHTTGCGPSPSPSPLNPVSAAWNNASPQTNESANWMSKLAITTGMQQQMQPPIAPFSYGQDGSYAQNGFPSQQQAQGGYNASNTAALLNRGQPAQPSQPAQPAHFDVPGHLSGYLRGDFDSQSIALRAAFSQSRHVSPNSFAAVPPASYMIPGQSAVASQYIQQQVLNGHNMFVPGALPSQHAGLSFGNPVFNANVTGSLRDRDPSRSMRGHLLKEFLESRGNRNFELLDIVGHVVEFSGDQHGSRFIQTKLETANKDTKDIIFGDLANNIVPLAMDVFGNYVIQKFLEHGSQKQKEYIAKQMKGRMIDLSTQTYSCRVVQRVMQSALLEQKVELARELDGHVLRVAKDASGNHVVLRIMSDVDRSELDFLVDAFRTKIVDLSAHIFGCRIVQNLYADGLDSDRDMIMSELKDHVQELSMGHYGNYVIQKIIKGRNAEHKALILNAVMARLIPLCKEKHASNVVETCFISGSYEDRRRILQGIMKEDKPNVSIFYELMNDQFGNYVLRKLLGHLEGEDKALLAKHLTVQVDLCKKSGLVNPKTGIERIANALEALGDVNKAALSTKDADSPRTESSKLSSPDSKSASRDEATPPLTETPNSPDSSNPPSVRSGPLETDVAKSGESLPAIPAIAQPSDE